MPGHFRLNTSLVFYFVGFDQMADAEDINMVIPLRI